MLAHMARRWRTRSGTSRAVARRILRSLNAGGTAPLFFSVSAYRAQIEYSGRP